MKPSIVSMVTFVVFLMGIEAAAVPPTSLREVRDIFPMKNNVSFLAVDDYDLVIIAPLEFSNDLQPLIEHKNTCGIRTFLKTTDEIYTEYEGRDQAEQIKYFIKDALEQWHIRYVLLIGGRKGQLFNWHVPVRYSNLNDGASGYTQFISDLYYADIYTDDGVTFEDWDSDDDGIFAEWTGFTNKDILDLTPDVSVGRLPCRNRYEVKTVVSKIIEYETSAYGKTWTNTLVTVGGNTFPTVDDPRFPYEGESICTSISEYLEGYTLTSLFTSDGTLTSPEDIVDALNQGCGLFFTSGRGGTDRIRMVMPEGTEFVAFHNKYIPQLNNKGMYPICVLGECIHAKFDVSLLNILGGFSQQNCIPECIAWRLIRKPGGGAIAVITNTNICYGATGDQNDNEVLDMAEIYVGGLSVEVFRLLGQENLQYLGDLHAQTLRNYVNRYDVMSDKIHCKSVEEFTLLGDPSLRIGGYP